MTATTSNTLLNKTIFKLETNEQFTKMYDSKVLINLESSGHLMKFLNVTVAVQWLNPENVHCSKRTLEVVTNDLS